MYNAEAIYFNFNDKSFKCLIDETIVVQTQKSIINNELL